MYLSHTTLVSESNFVCGRSTLSISCSKYHTDSTKKLSETDIIYILEFLIDNLFVMFGGHVFQQMVGIPTGTNCAPLLVDLFHYSYAADFIPGLARSLKFTFRYIYDVLSLNNSRFGDFVDRIYPIELEIKDTTYTGLVKNETLRQKR